MPRRLRPAWGIKLPFVIASAVACSHLPDFAAPKAGEVQAAPLKDEGDLVSYRALERADFKRRSPPAQTTFGKYSLGAQTCTALYTEPLRIQVRQITKPNGQTHFDATLQNLRFHASMDRECSWWNPTNHDTAYTLQHEQIHFALAELTARSMNQKAPGWVRELRGSGSTQKAATDPIEHGVREHIERYNRELMDRQRELDEDTSVGRNPERQQRWWQRVSRELEETRDWH